MTYTIDELDKAFENGFTTADGCELAGWNSHWELEHYNSGTKSYENESFTLDGIGTAVFVEVHGGGEGDGETHWAVVKVTDAEGNVRYFRKPGWYASYDGAYLDGDTEEVRAAERVVTVWEKI